MLSLAVTVVRLLIIVGLFLGVTEGRHGAGESEPAGAATLTSISPSPTHTTAISAPSSTTASTNTIQSPPTQSPIFAIDQPANATTCQSMIFTWHAPQDDIRLTFTVTNERAARPAGEAQNEPLVQSTLSTNVSSIGGRYNWNKVNVTEGFYSLLAFDSPRNGNISILSPVFFVRNGSDVSCFLQTSATMTAATSSSTSSTSSLPSHGGSSHLGTGALIGTIIAVVLGVAGLILAFSVPRLWRHALPSLSQQENRRRPGAPYYLF